MPPKSHTKQPKDEDDAIDLGDDGDYEEEADQADDLDLEDGDVIAGEEAAAVDSDAEDGAGGVLEYAIEDDSVGQPSAHTETVQEIRVIRGSARRTADTVTKLECANILGLRAVHLDNGAAPYVDTSTHANNRETAYYELMSRLLPFKIFRSVGPQRVEEWHLDEMKLPKLPPVEHFI